MALQQEAIGMEEKSAGRKKHGDLTTVQKRGLRGGRYFLNHFIKIVLRLI